MYEVHYGICNHLDRNNARPLASVALHPAEDINTGSFLEESIRLYISRNIKELYHLSLIEFMELPRDIVRMLCDIAGEENSRKATMMSQIEDQFKRAGN